MSKDEKIPNIQTDWEGYTGKRVQEFIKGELASLDKEKLDINNIVQGFGNDIQAPMSQDAITQLLGRGYMFGGVITPQDKPFKDYKGNVFYIAKQAGTYTNFGGIVVADKEQALIKWNGSTWNKEIVPFGSDIEVVQELGNSTTNVMSQKAVNIAILDVKRNIPFKLTPFGYYGSTDGKIYSAYNNNYNGYLVPVNGGDNYEVNYNIENLIFEYSEYPVTEDWKNGTVGLGYIGVCNIDRIVGNTYLKPSLNAKYVLISYQKTLEKDNVFSTNLKEINNNSSIIHSQANLGIKAIKSNFICDEMRLYQLYNEESGVVNQSIIIKAIIGNQEIQFQYTKADGIVSGIQFIKIVSTEIDSYVIEVTVDWIKQRFITSSNPIVIDKNLITYNPNLIYNEIYDTNKKIDIECIRYKDLYSGILIGTLKGDLAFKRALIDIWTTSIDLSQIPELKLKYFGQDSTRRICVLSDIDDKQYYQYYEINTSPFEGIHTIELTPSYGSTVNGSIFMKLDFDRIDSYYTSKLETKFNLKEISQTPTEDFTIRQKIKELDNEINNSNNASLDSELSKSVKGIQFSQEQSSIELKEALKYIWVEVYNNDFYTEDIPELYVTTIGIDHSGNRTALGLSDADGNYYYSFFNPSEAISGIQEFCLPRFGNVVKTHTLHIVIDWDVFTKYYTNQRSTMVNVKNFNQQKTENRTYREQIVLNADNWKGKTIVCIGDSLTEFTDNSGETYANYIARFTGATVYNIGIGGTQLCQRTTPQEIPTDFQEAYAGLDMINLVKAITSKPQDYTMAINCANWVKENARDDNTAIIRLLTQIDFNKVDAITINGGSNDFNNAIGKWGVSGSTDINTSLGALNEMIRLLSTHYPNIKLFFFTPVVSYQHPYQFERDKSYNIGDLVAYAGVSYKFIQEHPAGAWKGNDVEKIEPHDYRIPELFCDNKIQGGKTKKDFCKMLTDEVELHHIPYCDLYNTLGWNIYNFSNYFNDNDNAHPRKGFDEIAKKMIGFIKANQTF